MPLWGKAQDDNLHSAERLTVFSKCIIMEHLRYGEVAERFNAAVLKTVVGASLPGVRISPSPPFQRKGV